MVTMRSVTGGVHAEQFGGDGVQRGAVEDVKEHVLRQMTLRQDPQRPLAQKRAVSVADVLPRLDQPICQLSGAHTARSRQRGQHTMVVVEIGVQIAVMQPELRLERLLVERDPVATHPFLVRQPVV